MLEPLVRRVGEIEVANVPVGQGAILSFSIGLARGLSGIAAGLGLPAPAASAAVSWAAGNLRFISNLLGPTLSKALSATAMAVAVNQVVDLQNMAYQLVQRVSSMLGGPQLAALPHSSPTKVSAELPQVVGSSVARKIGAIK